MNRMVSRLCACLLAFSLFAALCGRDGRARRRRL